MDDSVGICAPSEGEIISHILWRILQVDNVAVIIQLLIIGGLFFYLWQLRKDRLEEHKAQSQADEISARANLKLAEALGEIKATLTALLTIGRGH